MLFDLATAIPVVKREDGLLEKDTFDLSTARPVETTISAPKEPFRYSPPLTDEQKAQANVELSYKEAGKKVPIGLQADWLLTSEPAKLATKNILGAIATGGIVPLYNIAKGIADASSPNSDIGKMVFDSAYKGLAENQKVQELGGAAQKAYPDLPWQITGSMGALAEVLMFMPQVASSSASLLSKDKQFTIALNNARQSPKWGDLVITVAKKVNQPIETVDQVLYNKLWGLRGESDYFKVLNGNLKKATGIDLFSEAGSIPLTRAKIGQSVNFTDPQGLVKSGIIKELTGERAIINLEGREVVATLSQLSLPKVEEEVKRVSENLLKNNSGITQKDAEAMAKDVIENRKFNQPQPTGEGKVLTNQDLAKSGVTQDNYKEFLVKGADKITESQFVAAKQLQQYEIKGELLPIEEAQKWYRSELSTPTGQKPPIEPIGKASETKPPELQKELPPQTPIPPEITIPPSDLPPEGSMPSESDPVKKLIQALKEAKPIRAEQEALMKAERGRRIAKSMAMGSKIPGEAGFYAQLGSLKGALPKAQFESLRGKINQKDIDFLFNKIRNSDLNEWDKIGVQTGLGKILGEFGGTVPTEGELKGLHSVFGKEFTDSILANRTLLQKFMYASGEVLNVPRSVMASFDLSAPLRQGAFMIGRQKQFAPAFGEMFKYFGSEKAFNALMTNIQKRPTYNLMREHGLSITDMEAGLTGREEKFMSSWAERIPLAGIAIKSSGRAYTGFLNKLRADVFDDLYNKAKILGIPETDKFMKDLVTFINSATGRGTLGKFDKVAVGLNSVFFSPRLMASRLNLLNPAFYVNKEPFVRKEMLKSLLAFAGVIATILGLSKLGGAEVGYDWRSADFGKIKIGNTRIDILAGFQQYMRMAGQLITGEYISSHTGKIMTLGEGYKALNRWDILMRQLESKESPVMSFIASWLKGKSYTGEDFNVGQEVATRFIPMVIGDMVDLVKENPALFPLGLTGLFGVGLQTYDSSSRRSSSTRSSAVKNRRSSSTR